MKEKNKSNHVPTIFSELTLIMENFYFFLVITPYLQITFLAENAEK